MVQMLSNSPQSIRHQATISLSATPNESAGLPDASHINVGISPTKSTKPRIYPNISLNFFMSKFAQTI